MNYSSFLPASYNKSNVHISKWWFQLQNWGNAISVE